MMANDAGERRVALQRGRWIPWIFVAGFGVVVAVNAIMIYIAATTWTGITTNRSYDKGLTYNRNLEAAARQEALGWQVAIETTTDGEREGSLKVSLADAEGAPLERAQLTATFERPTHEGYDFALELAPAGGGIYAARFTVPLDGVWDLRIVVTHGHDLLVESQRLFLR